MLAPAGTPMYACLILWVTSIPPLATAFPPQPILYSPAVRHMLQRPTTCYSMLCCHTMQIGSLEQCVNQFFCWGYPCT